MPQHAKYMRLKKGSFSKVAAVKQDGTLVAQEWLYCREYFQDESQGIKRILFCHKECRSKNISAFLQRVEDILALEQRSMSGPTQRYNISWVFVSPWWTSSSMKRSLFTIFLRCGQNYDPIADNFDSALLSCSYSKNTEYAVRRFLDGNTRYTGTVKGWYNQFRWGGKGFGADSDPSVENEIVDRLLIKPA